MAGQWAKGKSGNSKGRPTSGRALANTLRTMGDHDSFGALSNKVLLAQMIWEALAYGKLRFANGEMLNLSAREWLDLVKWVHQHVDGPYQPEPAVEQGPDKEVLVYRDNVTAAIEPEARPEDDPEDVRRAEAALMRMVNEG